MASTGQIGDRTWDELTLLRTAVDRNDNSELLKYFDSQDRSHEVLVRFHEEAGETLLHYACRKGCSEAFAKTIIHLGIDVNYTCGKWTRTTPVILACRYATSELCDCLLQLGASLTETSDDGETALHAACRNEVSQDEAIVRLLLLKYGAYHLVNRQDAMGCCPLLIVCNTGSRSLEVCELLLKHGADVNQAGSYEGWTALHCACRYNKPDLVRYLLEQGADPMLKDYANGEFALTKAAENGLEEVVTVLLEWSAVHRMEALWNALLMAATQRHGRIVEMILGCMEERTINQYLVPSLSAIFCGDVATVRDIMQNEPKRMSNQVTQARLLLMAAATGHCDVVAYLLRQSIGLADIQDEAGLSALHLASYAGHATCVQELVGAGADVNITDKCKKSALIHASFGSSFSDTENCFRVLYFLLKNGADPNTRSLSTTSLHRLAMTGSPHQLRLLVRFGASLTATNIYYRCPIAAAWRTDLTKTLDDLFSKTQRSDFEILMTSYTGLYVSHKQQMMAELQKQTYHSEKGQVTAWQTKTNTKEGSKKYEYRTSAEPRGFAVIICLHPPEDDAFTRRDAVILTDLFRFLRFSPVISDCHSAEAVYVELKRISQLYELWAHDAVAITLLADGQQRKTNESEQTVIELGPILNIFNDKQCPALAGKPKLIIAHTCPRGFLLSESSSSSQTSPCLHPPCDDTVCCQPTTDESRSRDEVILQNALTSRLKITEWNVSSSRDVYAIQPDVVAWSDQNGSEFLTTLVRVTRDRWRSSHLEDIMYQVCKESSQQGIVSNGRVTKSIFRTWNTLSKKLYF